MQPLSDLTGLNAPFGARCFLTKTIFQQARLTYISLNAPFGARCFLTAELGHCFEADWQWVLMHLLALGAF